MNKIKCSAIFIALLFIVGACGEAIKPSEDNTKSQKQELPVSEVIKTLVTEFGEAQTDRITRGVNQVASLWNIEDGTGEEFTDFCKSSFIADDESLKAFFNKFSYYYEQINGRLNQLSIDLKKNLHLDNGPLSDLDQVMGGIDPFAHVNEDFYTNKTAFMVALNFPFTPLEEKMENGKNWSREQWAYSRLGDLYKSRTPSELLQEYSKVSTDADTYISEYNIYMGNLRDENGEKLFPDDLKLITHWGLRDELKSNYITENGFNKQRLIYEVMKDIINQDIPEKVVNNEEYTWNPYMDKMFQGDKEETFTKEPDTRYKHMLNIFRSLRKMDETEPYFKSYIERKFSGEMEISQPDVEKLFIEVLSSPKVKEVAELIKSRLGRDLQPFDIWYNGFRAGSSVSEEKLDAMTESRYPNPQAFKNELPVILTKLGFDKDKADYISDKIVVDPSRGAGHAWGTQMKGDVSHLRTRIAETGMNYKGYNIAIHEFGHNVEQTLTMYDMDYYMLNGVPNTAFTEAVAFLFQKKDLELLGMKEENELKEHIEALEIFWSSYEIMGVSLVDMYAWKWLYENPEATEAQLHEAVVRIAKEVWNNYYAEVFGTQDEPILAIYSHMIDAPLYLSAYPIGHLIDFQIGRYVNGKEFAPEIMRMLSSGRIVPQLWMKNAVGKELSSEPILSAVEEALEKVKE